MQSKLAVLAITLSVLQMILAHAKHHESTHINHHYYSRVSAYVRITCDWYSRQSSVFALPLPAVYKEGLGATIAPTVEYLNKAIAKYAKRGGHCSIFINDDGLQLISDKDRRERLAYYEHHSISYVARPGNDQRVRRGLFKKASNMNYAMNVSRDVERVIAEEAVRGGQISALSALEEVRMSLKWHEEFMAGGDITMGEIILLIDADTVIPEDCLWQTMGEFIDEPKVALTQHFTSPLPSPNPDYWERMMSHFTQVRCALEGL